MNSKQIKYLNCEANTVGLHGGAVGKNPPAGTGCRVQTLVREDLTRGGTNELRSTTAEPVLWSLRATTAEATTAESHNCRGHHR